MVKISPQDWRMPPKGKAAQASKKTEGRFEEADLFKIFLTPDEESSPEDTLSKFKDYLHYKSIAELNDLHRKIRVIRDKTLKEPVTDLCDSFHESIDEKIRYSQGEEKNLKQMIEKKLQPLSINGVKRTPSRTLTHIKIDEKWMRAAHFIHTYLKEEFELADQLIADAILLVPHQLHGPLALTKNILNTLI